MASQFQDAVRPNASTDPVTVLVDVNKRGRWQMELPDQEDPVTFETLEDAWRAASLYAARGRPCKLIARDAYQHVVRCEYIPGHDDVVSHNGWFG
jgi:hypothetical protein